MSMTGPVRIPLPAPTAPGTPSTADAANLAATRERAAGFEREQQARSLSFTGALGAQEDDWRILSGEQRQVRAILARAHSLKAEGRERLLGGGIWGALVTFTAFAVGGPVAAAVVAVGGFATLTFLEGDRLE